MNGSKGYKNYLTFLERRRNLAKRTIITGRKN